MNIDYLETRMSRNWYLQYSNIKRQPDIGNGSLCVINNKKLNSYLPNLFLSYST